uniref:Ptx20 n=1 Tax=Pseudomonas savastanoi pv. phaseolicola TaxID=319 RepID=Q3S8Y1_PSESH|nr:Ptx20 [Pseudomonas savastanoi pv. phaseolicola]
MISYLKNPAVSARVIVIFIDRVVEKSIVAMMTIVISLQFGVERATYALITAALLTVVGSIAIDALARKVDKWAIVIVSEVVRGAILLILAVVISYCPKTYMVYLLFLVSVSVLGGISATLSDSLLIEMTKNIDRAVLYSLIYWVRNLALILGPLIVMLVYPSGFIGYIGFVGLVSVVLTGILFFWCKVPVTLNVETSNAGSLFGSLSVASKDRSFIIFLLASTIMSTIALMPSHYIAVRLAVDFSSIPMTIFFREFSLSGVDLSNLMRSANSLFVLVLTLPVYYLKPKLSEMQLLVAGMLLFGLGFTIASMSSGIFVLLVAVFLYSLGATLFVPIHFSIFARLCNDEHRNIYVAVSEQDIRVAALLSALSLVLVNSVNSSWVALLVAFLSGLTLWLYQRVLRDVQ